MDNTNDVLKLLATIVNTTEKQILIEANYLEYLESKKVGEHIIDKQTFKLAEMINTHEQLESKFAELLQILEDQTIQFKTLRIAANTAIEKYKSIALINKDAIYWRDKANYYNATRKILNDELQRLKAENQQLKNGQNIKAGGC